MRLNGKVAVITGAGSGMGRATADLFTAEGASVVASDWNAKTLDETVAEIRAKGGKITGIKGNVAVREDAEAMIELAVETYGRMDVLVNNAGVMDYNHGVGAVADDIWERVLGVNLNGPMYTSRKAVQQMLASGGGSIINISSSAGVSGAAAGAAYTSSKHGLIGLTRSTAWIYAQKGIRCNAILPGATQTNIVAGMDETRWDPLGTERMGVFQAAIPAYLESVDIAHLALFLASNESRFINGAIITADAGWLAT